MNWDFSEPVKIGAAATPAETEAPKQADTHDRALTALGAVASAVVAGFGAAGSGETYGVEQIACYVAILFGAIGFVVFAAVWVKEGQ